MPPTRRRAAQSTQQRASYQSPQSLRARELARFAYSNSEGVSHAPVRGAASAGLRECGGRWVEWGQ